MELEIICCSLEDALAAWEGGATRFEVIADLEQAGLTPPLALVEELTHRVPVPLRVMLREQNHFILSGAAELETLQARAREFARLKIDGLVTGYVKDGELDLDALAAIFSAAPESSFTFHHAIEMTADPAAALRSLGAFPQVDRALVKGGAGSLAERIRALNDYGRAFGPHRRLIAGGNLTLDMLPALLRGTGIREFHLGRAVRTPETAGGRVDARKVRQAAQLLRDAER